MEKSLPSPEGRDIGICISPKHQPQVIPESPAPREKLAGGVWSSSMISGRENRLFC